MDSLKSFQKITGGNYIHLTGLKNERCNEAQNDSVITLHVEQTINRCLTFPHELEVRKGHRHEGNETADCTATEQYCTGVFLRN